MKEIYDFLKDLKRNNNRDWFNANKDRYIDVKRKIDEFASMLIAELSTIDPDASGLTPSDCTYRIYRDTRFSADKTPYKTHVGIYICPKGNKKSYRAGYYIHLEPGGSFIGGGCWCPPAPLLKEIRKSIYDNVEEYLEIIGSGDFKNHYTEVGSNYLKTAPKGFPKDWEHIDLLKPRDYTVLAQVSDSFFQKKDSVKKIGEYMRALKPYNDFINFLIDEDPSLDPNR